MFRWSCLYSPRNQVHIVTKKIASFPHGQNPPEPHKVEYPDKRSRRTLKFPILAFDLSYKVENLIKMIANITCCGTDHSFEAVRCSVFELDQKKMANSTEIYYRQIFPKIKLTGSSVLGQTEFEQRRSVEITGVYYHQKMFEINVGTPEKNHFCY